MAEAAAAERSLSWNCAFRSAESRRPVSKPTDKGVLFPRRGPTARRGTAARARPQHGAAAPRPGSRGREGRAAAAGSGTRSRWSRPPLPGPSRAGPTDRPTASPSPMSFSLTLRGKLAIYGAALQTGSGAERNLRPGATQLQRPPLAGRSDTETKWRRRGGERRPRPAGGGGRSSSCLPCLRPSSLRAGVPASSALLPPVGSSQRSVPSAPLAGLLWIPNRPSSRCPTGLDSAPCRSQHTFLEVVTAPKVPWMCSHCVWAKKDRMALLQRGGALSFNYHPR